MISVSFDRSRKLAAFVARVEQANNAHDQAEAMAEHATALDLALERDAAEHGIGFDEIVFEALKAK